jgi:large subunit ribosomal protein L25
MAKQTELAISPRVVTGKATKQLRKVGIIPANIFGHGEESQTVQVEEGAFSLLQRNHQTTSVITLKLPDEKKGQTALVRHVQRDPRSEKIVHIDFFRVNLKDRLISKVALHFIGVAPGVKAEGGVLLHLTDTLEVECAAGDIIESIDVDISILEHIDETIHARDVKLPEHYTLITNPDESVVKVTPPRIDETPKTGDAPVETPAASAGE